MYLSTAISGTNDTSFRFSAWQLSWAVLCFLPGGARAYLQPFLGAFGVEEPQRKPTPRAGREQRLSSTAWVSQKGVVHSY